MKNVLIATPCLDQKVDAYFVDSLQRSIKMGLKEDIDITCIFLSNESILPIARNELLNLAYQEKYDAMVFIDDDECWAPKALIDIIHDERDVIALPVANKSDNPSFNVLQSTLTVEEDGYCEVEKIGSGFIKLTKAVIEDLWNSSEELIFRNKPLKNVFEYTYDEHSFIGEDITLCNKLRELDYTIWLNTNYTVSHIGNKFYHAEIKDFL